MLAATWGSRSFEVLTPALLLGYYAVSIVKYDGRSGIQFTWHTISKTKESAAIMNFFLMELQPPSGPRLRL